MTQKNHRTTAVEWLLNQYANNSVISLYDILEASRMEKESIMDAYSQGVADEAKEIIYSTKDAKEYYEKTYGN